MRLSEDSAVVSIHVLHGLNDERLEQEEGDDNDEHWDDDNALPAPEDHALLAALHVLWRYHRMQGFKARELADDLEEALEKQTNHTEETQA